MAGTWRQDILNNVYLSGDSELVNKSKNQADILKSIPILLVGNKVDKVRKLFFNCIVLSNCCTFLNPS